jgi:hypothetical protein
MKSRMFDNQTKWVFFVAKNDLFFYMRRQIKSPSFRENLEYSMFCDKTNESALLCLYIIWFPI